MSNDIEVFTTDQKAVPLTREQARELTDDIKRHAERLWELLLKAHERKAWAALGYDRWEDYVRTEFDMSRQRSYQILDQGRAVQAIAEAAMSTDVDITEAEARDIKPHLEQVTAEVRERVEAGENPEHVVPEVVSAVRAHGQQTMTEDRIVEESTLEKMKYRSGGVKPRRKGRAFQRAVANWLKLVAGFSDIEPTEFNDAQEGDLRNIPHWSIEIKNEDTEIPAKEARLAQWMQQAADQSLKAGATWYAVIHKQKGKADPGQSYVTLPLHVFGGHLAYVRELEEELSELTERR